MNWMTIGLLLAIVSTLSLIAALLAVRPFGEVRRTSPGLLGSGACDVWREDQATRPIICQWATS